MGREKKRFPIGAFFPLAIGHEAEDLPPLPVEFFPKGQSGREWKPMPEASGREKHFRMVRGRMPAQGSLILVEKL